MSYSDDIIEGVQAYISQKERDKLPESDFAWPEERKYPISNQAHLDAAVKLLGKAPAGKRAAIKKRIVEIAKKKGLTLPQDWQK